MLFTIDGAKATRIPHAQEYAKWRRLISVGDLQLMADALNAYADAHEVFVSGHIPGSDWRGTPYQPIYEALKNVSESAPRFMFGLIVWQVMMDRPDGWVFMRSERERSNDDPQGLTYFRR